MKYVALLRGINVGGKNKLPMSDLRTCLATLGLSHISTLLNSGNALFETDHKQSSEIAHSIEKGLAETFRFDSTLIKVMVLSEHELRAVLASAPEGFGKHPDTYHSDVAFVMEGAPEMVAQEFVCHPDIDTVWPGKRAVFYQRLSSHLTKSRLSKIITKPVYKNLTIRTWSTANKILTKMDTAWPDQ